MVKREIQRELKQLLKEYPVVVILGPRQSGKTTLSKTLKGYHYCNLENPENREFASQDPKAFLKQFQAPVIFDEIQRVPSLLSYVQVIVDEKKKNGQFVLTGSHQMGLKKAMTQSLAGRAGLLKLLTFSISELEKAGFQYKDFQDYIHRGFLPRVYDQKQRPFQAYSNYYQTYIERDIFQMIDLKNQSLFEKFMKLLAGRSGQILNVDSLGRDTGVDSKTIKSWLSVLEASFIIYKLCPYFENFGKRVLKSPKYYFTEVGLLAFLLGIQKKDHVTRDPLVGNLFENLVVIECLKSQFNQGHPADFYFFRDSNENEIDLIWKIGSSLMAFEIKSSSTYQPSLLKNFQKIKKLHPKIKQVGLIYSGKSIKMSDNNHLIHFKKISDFLNKKI